MRKKAKIIENGYNYEILLNYDFLQRVVRHPDYQELCDPLVFDEDGFAVRGLDLAFLSPQEIVAAQEERIDIIREKFGVSVPIRPNTVISENYPPEFFSNIPVLERHPYAVSLRFKMDGEDDRGCILSTPIFNGQFLRLDIDPMVCFDKQIKSGIKSYISTYREMVKAHLSKATPCKVLRKDETSITVEIDLAANEKDIFFEIRKHIRPSKKRYHLKKRTRYYRIWDLRIDKKMRYPQIALELQKEGMGKIKPDAVRKGLHTAYELIIGKNPNWSYLKNLRRILPGCSSHINKPPFSHSAFDMDNRLEDQSAANKFSISFLLRDLKECVCKGCNDQECHESIIDALFSNDPTIRTKNPECERLLRFAHELNNPS